MVSWGPGPAAAPQLSVLSGQEELSTALPRLPTCSRNIPVWARPETQGNKCTASGLSLSYEMVSATTTHRQVLACNSVCPPPTGIQAGKAHTFEGAQGASSPCFLWAVSWAASKRGLIRRKLQATHFGGWRGTGSSAAARAETQGRNPSRGWGGWAGPPPHMGPVVLWPCGQQACVASFRPRPLLPVDLLTLLSLRHEGFCACREASAAENQLGPLPSAARPAGSPAGLRRHAAGGAEVLHPQSLLC